MVFEVLYQTAILGENSEALKGLNGKYYHAKHYSQKVNQHIKYNSDVKKKLYSMEQSPQYPMLDRYFLYLKVSVYFMTQLQIRFSVREVY